LLEKNSKSQGYYIGYLTAADFVLAVQATYLQAAFQDKFEKYKNLKSIKEKIDSLP
jgi:hypothetical protein